MTYRVSITITNKCNQLPWHNVTSVHVTMDQMGMLLVFRGKKDDGSRYDVQILLGPDDSILIEGEDWE